MERLRLRYTDAKRALDTLKEILEKPFSIVVRDATIQRFEYTFEALWKFLKEYLKEQEGIISNSPKTCFRDAFSAGLLSEEEAVKFLEMTDDRNMTAHTYNENVAQILYKRINEHSVFMERLMQNIEKKWKLQG
ncbi:MAG: nucleotidyltransferase [Deltaproteobacteria bacterium RIFCSPLOWO2_12_FULL_43_16]|nr:MAG: nucleotidyltransferase [Deltaproteobacteria bacterium RIFCSPHIGHO2_02_FULL_43_33]OGQ09839.1 MAG: nucleotidyltransferase [Deltaproteobacteria bacterium RIFCSPHIGHO2_02_FULL_43_33]OGQ58244.1 MAG: nucleotidyltransferase [Deltaproteobacteria bacterium RIFCSPLOWO2_12_FULL_43_16]HBR17186.1 nucleotidyltransferase [Deltaproteobacteria bacterium]